MSFTCQHCSTELSDISSLKRHQRQSKYCLRIQKGKDDDSEKQTIFNCIFCKKKLSSKYRLQCHLDICKLKNKEKEKEKEKEKTESELEQMRTEMAKLKKEVEILKEKPTITINNSSTTNNNYGSILNCLTQEVIQETFKNFSIKDLLASDSQKNLADMTIKKCLSGPNQPIYICKDRSRHKFFYTDEENKEKEDPNAIVLRTLVYNGVKPLIKKLYAEKSVILQNELARCKRKDDLTMITMSREDIKELEDAYKHINIVKDGEDYITHLGKCLPSSVKDRIYQDHLSLSSKPDKDLDSDEELQAEIRHQTRMIGDYTASELSKWKKLYMETGEVTGPRELETNIPFRKQFIAFLKEGSRPQEALLPPALQEFTAE
jgi:hypothetical protein